MHAGLAPTDRVLLHVVEMCCLNETLTGVYLTEMLHRATHVTARAAVESLLEDEIDHGRVGWAYLASRLRAETAKPLAAALPTLLDRAIGPVIAEAARAPESDEPALEAHAWLGRNAAATLYREALENVIFAGFETLGVDVGPLRAHARARGWS